MKWERGKDGYYTTCETHTISRTFHRDHWVIALWNKHKREYTEFRRAVTLDEQKSEVLALKEIAGADNRH